MKIIALLLLSPLLLALLAWVHGYLMGYTKGKPTDKQILICLKSGLVYLLALYGLGLLLGII